MAVAPLERSLQPCQRAGVLEAALDADGYSTTVRALAARIAES